MHYDAIVIGGSFAGASAALQIGRMRREVCVIDSRQPRNVWSDAMHGVFGYDGVEPHLMLLTAQERLSEYGNITLIIDDAVSARNRPNGFAVTLASGKTLTATKLVLAFGVLDSLQYVSGFRERWGRSVLHSPHDQGYEFGGRRLGVLYNSLAAVPQALVLTDLGPTTFFLNGHPRPDDAQFDLLVARGATVEPEKIACVEGRAPHMKGVRMVDGRFLEMEAIFLVPSTRLSSLIAEQLGCAIHEGVYGPYIRTNENRMTSVPGVYAAGDIVRATHNATLAAADGVTAGKALHKALVFEPLEALERQAAIDLAVSPGGRGQVH